MDPQLLMFLQADVSRRLLDSPTFDRFIPLPAVGSADEVGLSISTKQLDQKTNTGEMTVTGVLSDEREPDRARETVLLDGMDLSGWARNPLGLYQHNKMLPVALFRDKSGNFTVSKVGKQLLGTYHFVQTGPMAQLSEQVFQLVETKVLNGNSIGFIAGWGDYVRTPDDPTQPYGPATTVIRKSKGFECSLVYIPENDRSLVTSVVRKGLSNKPLLNPLVQMLAPYADPEAVWANGWGGGTKAAETDPKALEYGEHCTKCGNKKDHDDAASNTKNMHCKKCMGEATKDMTTPNVITKEVHVVPPAVQQKADGYDWYERVVTKKIGLPCDEYAGKPSQKALQAMYDTAMFSALNALETAGTLDGPVEVSLAGYVRDQMRSAEKCADEYQKMFGDRPEWAEVGVDDLHTAFANPNPSELLKSLCQRAVNWASRVKGWRKGHATRTTAASKFLREQANIAALPEEVRKAAREHADRLDNMVMENGIFRPIEDDVTSEKIKQIESIQARQEEEIARLKKQLKAARGGVY